MATARTHPIRRRPHSLAAIATVGTVLASCDAVLGIVEYPSTNDDAGTDDSGSSDASLSIMDSARGDVQAMNDGGDSAAPIDGDAPDDAIALPPPDAFAPATCDGGGFQPAACTFIGGTTIAGTIFDPAGGAPVPGVLVYIPQTAEILPPLLHGPTASCASCSDPSSLPTCPVTSAITRADGTFTLTEAPSGADLPLVVQLGHWRRQLVLPAVEACKPNAIDPALTRLPGQQGPGVDMPLIAIATACDPIECALQRYGWAGAEFTTLDGGGSVHVYPTAQGAWVGDGGLSEAGLTQAPQGTLTVDDLAASAALLSKYDAVLFPCECNPVNRASPETSNVAAYLSGGGRALFSHDSYTWLQNEPALEAAAEWSVDSIAPQQSTTAFVNRSLPGSSTFSLWLVLSGASLASGQVSLLNARSDFLSVAPSSELWLSGLMDGGDPLQFSAAVPIGSSETCGRFHFLDYHAENATSHSPEAFPNQCGLVSPGTASSSDRAIEYTLFDLLSCP